MTTEKVGVTVRLDPDTVAFLDQLATVQDLLPRRQDV